MRRVFPLLCSVVLLACGNGSRIQTSTTQLFPDPTSLHFGTLNAGESRVRSFHLRNEGRLAAKIKRISVVDDARGAFAVVMVGTQEVETPYNLAELTLGSGESIEVSVAYQAGGTAGADVAFVEVETTSVTVAERLVNLAGQVQAGTIPEVLTDAGTPTDAGVVVADDAGVPIAPLDITEGVVSIATGTDKACAVLKSGSVYCLDASDLAAAEVPGVSNAIQVDIDFRHACAVAANGRISCWGPNPDGQLGNGTRSTSPATTPVQVNGIVNAAQVAVSANHSCARLSTGEVYCWGSNEYAAAGQAASMQPSTSPQKVHGLPGPATHITVNDYASCAVVAAKVYCWGTQVRGTLGNGTAYNTQSPTPVLAPGAEAVLDVSGDYRTSCARQQGASVSCWGANDSGQFGDSMTTDAAQPKTVMTMNHVLDLQAGAFHSCAVLPHEGKRQAVCWGATVPMQTGTPVPAGGSNLDPVTIAGMNDVLAVHPGAGHYTCAIKVEQKKGNLYCWGRSPNGGSFRTTPIAVTGLP